MNLSSKQRAYLSSLASTINPIFNIGKASLTPEIIEALDAALEKRELLDGLCLTFFRCPK